MIQLDEEVFRNAMADAFKAGYEAGVFDLEMQLLGMMPDEGNAVKITNIGDIAHVSTHKGYIKLGSLIDNS